jgi:hypothetical protein
MTKEEKLKAIEDMGINWRGSCPDDYGLKENCSDDDFEIDEYCSVCWIKALES